MIHSVYGFKQTFEPYLTKMSGYSKARSFRFIKHQDNVAMFYKKSSLDNQWRGLPSDNSRGILLFKKIPLFDLEFASIPTKHLDDVIIGNILKCKIMIDLLSHQSKSFLTILQSG